MTDSERLDLILSEIHGMKNEMQDMKAETQGIKAEMQDMKTEMQDMKTEMQDMKGDIKDLKDRMELLEVKEDLTHKKLNDLTLDIKVSERSIRKDIRLLQDAQDTLITVLENQGILPVVK